ncbi:MAG TPA: hypothetical protein VK174_18185 [Chitinophagales bacterium]|nr:hypothetical protein [Chitinophagales bacterium]
MAEAVFQNKKLEEIFEEVWLNPADALAALDKLPVAAVKKTLTGASADAHVLRFILDILLQRFEGLDLEQEKLLAHYTNAKDTEKAALLHVWRMYAWILMGRLVEADKIRLAFAQMYKPEDAPLAYGCYYVFTCAYCERNGYYEDYIRLAQETETHVQIYDINPVWQTGLLCLAKLYRSRAHSNYNRPAEALQAMQQVEKDIEEYGLCSQITEQLLYCHVMHYENFGERKKAIQVLEDLVELTVRRKYSDMAKYASVANLLNTYVLRNRQLGKDEKEYTDNRKRQLHLISKSDKVVANSFETSATAFYCYAKAGFFLQEGDLNKGLQAIAKSIRIFYRYGHIRFLAQAYTAAHKIYKAGAIAGASYRMAYKAARCADQIRIMTDVYYKQVLKRRIESLELQFKIREKELNETMLKQQLEAMSKEIQLTTLNLHEKIQVLDELKTYVNSLKKKELETRQLINTIAKKIDSVKITEEDKAMLQQKISSTHQQFTTILAEKYPALSNLELRMCSLFQTGMTNKELAKLYGQGEKSYEQHRYRIKKKMGLGNDDKLVTHLLKLSTGK